MSIITLTMPRWDARQYLQFAHERTQPAVDLLSRIAALAPRTVIDLGCGPGNSTALLHHRSLAARVDLWVTEYQHVLDGPAAIVDWIRGTGLRPFLQALADDAERDRFEARLLAAVAAGYPRQADGRVLFPFRRLFVVASRGSA